MNLEENETLERAPARNVRDALAEVIGRVDWTAHLVPQQWHARAQVLAKEAADTAAGPGSTTACWRSIPLLQQHVRSAVRERGAQFVHALRLQHGRRA